MHEVNLVADLLIAMKEGIKSKKQVSKFYTQYEKTYDDDEKVVKDSFGKVIEMIGRLYPEEGLSR
jgi:hypothetical protein